MAFPDDLPIHSRPYMLRQHADYEDLVNSPTVVDTTDLRAAADDLVAKIQDPGNWTDPADALTFFDGRCSGLGYYEKINDTGDPADTGVYIHCVSCDGWGYTKTANTPTKVWPDPATL